MDTRAARIPTTGRVVYDKKGSLQAAGRRRVGFADQMRQMDPTAKLKDLGVAPSSDFMGSSLSTGVIVIGVVNFVVVLAVLSMLSSTQSQTFLGVSINRETQIAWGMWSLVGLPVIVAAMAGALYRIADFIYPYYGYFLLSTILYCLWSMYAVISGAVCVNTGTVHSFVKGNTRTRAPECLVTELVFFVVVLTVVLVLFYFVNIIYSCAENLRKEVDPSLVLYQAKLSSVPAFLDPSTGPAGAMKTPQYGATVSGLPATSDRYGTLTGPPLSNTNREFATSTGARVRGTSPPSIPMPSTVIRGSSPQLPPTSQRVLGSAARLSVPPGSMGTRFPAASMMGGLTQPRFGAAAQYAMPSTGNIASQIGAQLSNTIANDARMRSASPLFGAGSRSRSQTPVRSAPVGGLGTGTRLAPGTGSLPAGRY
mmetsp:Transcript_19762/g.48023  ORF Transcript_19762/g.48023 Transcript_19762/m.48023 type:complete len:424 (-) Transcript_19762:64-1335(-)